MQLEELAQKIDQQTKLLETLTHSIERVRRAFLTIIVISIVAFVLPLVGLVFAIPKYLQTLETITNM